MYIRHSQDVDKGVSDKGDIKKALKKIPNMYETTNENEIKMKM